MSKLNILVHLNSYLDAKPSNSPSLNSFRWTREVQGQDVGKSQSLEFCLAPGESRQLFDGLRALSHDNTTEYSISSKPGSPSVYVLAHESGAQPEFRAPRTTGADATTVAELTKNGSVLTLTSNAGTGFDFLVGGVQVGDQVRLTAPFAATNRGVFRVLAVSASALSFEHANGVAEGAVALGSGFAEVLQVFGAAGVQIGDTLVISSGFSPASYGRYEITAVGADFVEFFTTKSLPAETAVTDDINIYSQARRLVYLETNRSVGVQINGASVGAVNPIVEGDSSQPGVMLKNTVAWEMTVTNSGLEMANLYFASVE
jgi:hypothetical protein